MSFLRSNLEIFTLQIIVFCRFYDKVRCNYEQKKRWEVILISSNVVFATFCPDPDPGIFCIWNLGDLCFWNPEYWLWNLEYSSRNPESRRGSRIQGFLGSTIKIQRTIERRAPFVRCGNLFYVVDSTMHAFFWRPVDWNNKAAIVSLPGVSPR